MSNEKYVYEWLFRTDSYTSAQAMKIIRDGVESGHDYSTMGEELADQFIRPAISDDGPGADILHSLVGALDWSDIIDGEVSEEEERQKAEQAAEEGDEDEDA